MGTKKCESQTYELKYTGYLSDSTDLFLHYGYNGWDEVSECKMRKLKSCYKTEVTLPCEAKLDFCFRNDSGDWDNNYGNDYSFAYGSKTNYDSVELSEKIAKTTLKTTAVTKITTTSAKKTTTSRKTAKK